MLGLLGQSPGSIQNCVQPEYATESSLLISWGFLLKEERAERAEIWKDVLRKSSEYRKITERILKQGLQELEATKNEKKEGVRP